MSSSECVKNKEWRSFGKSDLRNIDSEGGDMVEVSFSYSDAAKASFVVRTDGIPAGDRNSVALGTKLVCMGRMSVSALRKKDFMFPRKDYHLLVSLTGKSGIFVLAPQYVVASELIAGKANGDIGI